MEKGQGPLPVPLNIQRAIDKGSRTNEGLPGKNYWQNGASYTIHTRFNPETRLLSGTEEIVYFNHSPDTLKQLLFKLYPNYYQKGAARAEAVKPADLMEGVSLSNLTPSTSRPISSRIFRKEPTGGFLFLNCWLGDSAKVSL